LAIVGVFPFGDTALATFLSLERFSFMGFLSEIIIPKKYYGVNFLCLVFRE